jgi:hypothetical protein
MERTSSGPNWSRDRTIIGQGNRCISMRYRLVACRGEFVTDVGIAAVMVLAFWIESVGNFWFNW